MAQETDDEKEDSVAITQYVSKQEMKKWTQLGYKKAIVIEFDLKDWNTLEDGHHAASHRLEQLFRVCSSVENYNGVKSGRISGSTYAVIFPDKYSQIMKKAIQDLIDCNIKMTIGFKGKAPQVLLISFQQMLQLWKPKANANPNKKQKLKDIYNGDPKFDYLFIDVDHMQQINDKFGRKKGNELLQKVLQILKSKSKHAKVEGGDEFMLQVENKGKKYVTGEQIAQQIGYEVRNIATYQGKPVITVTIGISYDYDSAQDCVEKLKELGMRDCWMVIPDESVLDSDSDE